MTIHLSVRRVPAEDMADGKPAIGCFVTVESGQEYVATLPIENLGTISDIADSLRFFAACVDKIEIPEAA